MTILCATDFSPPSQAAAWVAAAWAAWQGVELHLVHAIALEGGDAFAAERPSLLAAARQALNREVDRLAPTGAVIQTSIDEGAPERVVIEAATETAADLIVIGATGHGATPHRPLGNIADRLAHRAHVPVLVVRDGDRLTSFLRGEHELRVLVGVDPSGASAAAWRWAATLAELGDCRFILAHFYWPPEQYARLGLGGVRSCLESDPEVERVLSRELSERFAPPRRGSFALHIEPAIGQIADHLSLLAREELADLVVVGSHQHGALARLWEGTVSRAVLHHSGVSAVCVPAPAQAMAATLAAYRVVLAATDFSKAGDAAVAHALRIAGRGSTVHLVHVLEPSRLESPLSPHDIFASRHDPLANATEARLRALVPVEGFGPGIAVETHVLESRDTVTAIAQATERLGAEIVCVGAHGRGGLVRLALGSVALGLLGRVARPILITRAQKE